MIKVKVNNEYKDVVKIFCGGTLQKEIVKVWSREAQEYVYESSVEYTGTLPITITANGDALIDYRIYGTDGGVGVATDSGEPAGYKLPMTAMDNLAPPLSQWVEGYVSISGVIVPPYATNREKSSDFIEVDPNTTYVFSIEGGTFPQGTNGAWVGTGMYRDDWTFIRRVSTDKNGPYTFSTASDTKYIRLSYRTYGELLKPILSENSFSIPVYIGENQLTEGEYVSYGEQKIYRDVGGTLTPTDPPVPLPEIPTIDGTTVIDYDGDPKPSQMYVKYRR